MIFFFTLSPSSWYLSLKWYILEIEFYRFFKSINHTFLVTGKIYFWQNSLSWSVGRLVLWFQFKQNTWEHLPYIAVLKSVHRTATVCSSIHTFFRGSKLLTVAVLWTLATTPKSVHKTATVISFDPRKKVLIELQTVAVLWTLFKTAIYGRCSQVFSWISE